MQVKVFVKNGPAKGKYWEGSLLTDIVVGGQPMLTMDNDDNSIVRLSEVVKHNYEKETDTSYVLTRSGNTYIIARLMEQ
jgi:hypothetical protein